MTPRTMGEPDISAGGQERHSMSMAWLLEALSEDKQFPKLITDHDEPCQASYTLTVGGDH